MAEPLTQLAHGIYHNRNRTYMPSTGRFLQMDPNASFRQLAGTGYAGAVAYAGLASFDMESMYGDGFGLYGAYNHDPVNGADPSGLMLDIANLASQGNYGIFRGQMNAIKGLENLPPNDPFNAVVDYVTESIGAQAAYLGQLQKGFDAAASIAISVASLHPAVGAGLAIYHIANGEGEVWDYVELAGPAGKVLKKAIRAFRRAKRGYRQGSRGAFRVGRCNCVLAGSVIVTADGLVSVENLTVGQLILTRADSDPDAENVLQPILAISASVVRDIIEVEFDNTVALQLTPDHIVWSEDMGWIRASQIQKSSMLLDEHQQPVRITAVRRHFGEYVVYDLEVADTHTFFLSGIWIHNCIDKALDELPVEMFGRRGIPIDWKDFGQKPKFPMKAHDGINKKMAWRFKDADGAKFEIHWIEDPGNTRVWDVKEMPWTD